MPRKKTDRKRTVDGHFALGLVVNVRSGAKPVGWGDVDEFDEERPVRRQVSDVCESEELAPYGSYEVGGWFWDPRDIYIGYGDNG